MGCPGRVYVYVPIPAVVVPKPTIFALTFNSVPIPALSLIHSIFILPPSYFAVIIPTLDALYPFADASVYVSAM